MGVRRVGSLPRRPHSSSRPLPAGPLPRRPHVLLSCQDAGFWGGELELLVLSRMLRQPITVYRTAAEAGAGPEWFGFVPIVAHGSEYGAAERRKPVAILYTQNNHYDALVH